MIACRGVHQPLVDLPEWPIPPPDHVWRFAGTSPNPLGVITASCRAVRESESSLGFEFINWAVYANPPVPVFMPVPGWAIPVRYYLAAELLPGKVADESRLSNYWLRRHHVRKQELIDAVALPNVRRFVHARAFNLGQAMRDL